MWNTVRTTRSGWEFDPLAKVDRKPTESAILGIIADNPGIRARDIAIQLGISKGRVSQVITTLKAEKEVDQVHDGGRGLALRLSISRVKRQLLEKRWTRFRVKSTRQPQR